MEGKAKLGARILGIEPEASRSIMYVKESYLQAALKTIKQDYGSIEQYLTNQLGMDESKRAKLMSIYLN